MIERLLAAGLIVQGRGGARPRYAVELRDKRRPPTALEKEVLDLVAAGQQPNSTRLLQTARRAKEKVHLTKTASGFKRPKQKVVKPIWMPKERATGPAGERAPLVRVERTREIDAVSLVVALSGLNDLREDGGVGRHILWLIFKRTMISSVGPYVVRAFCPEQMWVSLSGSLEKYLAKKRTRSAVPTM
ncbi:MAG: hypothetical protein AAF661_15020 [Pseudomonadota bacterium]